MTKPFFLAIALLFSCLPQWAFAHAAGEHYIWLGVTADGVEGNVELDTRDLHELLGYDLDPEATITDEALAPVRNELEQYVSQRLSFSDATGALPLDIVDITPRSFSEGNFVQVHFAAGADRPMGRVLTVRDEIMVEEDLRHRGILLIRYDRTLGTEFRERETLVFSAFNKEQLLDLDQPPRLLKRLEFIWQGMLHIFIGLDHILFLVTLLFTAVLLRKDDAWQPVESFAPAFWNVFKIVTLFTLAHSVTLFLAGLGYIRLPGRLVETIIALSIILVCLNNLVGKFDSKKLWIIVVFGLFHGLGFASVMAELPFRMLHLHWIVLFFNIGVELGQLVIVGLVFPVLYALRGTRIYQPVILTGGSLLIALLAGYWMVQRALGLG
jgi:hypothetical protein